MPFPAAVLARFLLTSYAQPAVVFFCLSGVFQNFTWILVMESGAPRLGMVKPWAVPSYRVGRRALYAGGMIYVATAILAWWFPAAALIIISVVWVGWMLLGVLIRNDTPDNVIA
jgi:hypothetical protein